MATTTHFLARLMLVLVVLGVGANAQLSSNFYSSTCPNLLSIIKTAVDSAVSSDARMGASLLRLHFHDCFVNGCDASVLLDDTANFTGEKTAGPNANSLRGFDVIDTIKTQVERACPGIVSCADILSVAARDGVVALGGPNWEVQLGRRDSTTASIDKANTDIPSPLMDLTALISTFSNQGLNVKDLVVLSGGHTIGFAKCSLFRNRIYNESNIDSSFSSQQQATCPLTGGDSNLAPLDTTAAVFDTKYFDKLVMKKGLLHSDQQLFNGGETDCLVQAYSSDPDAFAMDFADSMIKMGNISPLTRDLGQIRCNCRKVN
ncbi:Cationic peroxidase 1 [Sesamum alatum]|uniref:Peroxidase n=1 Tax=Sesamum alatum TaxID=300844 RepID=A0AAE1XWG0_9LAMI|nr:Cationic peroxidase 1 [Sesamum alatum]